MLRSPSNTAKSATSQLHILSKIQTYSNHSQNLSNQYKYQHVSSYNSSSALHANSSKPLATTILRPVSSTNHTAQDGQHTSRTSLLCYLNTCWIPCILYPLPRVLDSKEDRGESFPEERGGGRKEGERGSSSGDLESTSTR